MRAALILLAMALAGSLSATPVFAHGKAPAAQHGGQMQDAHGLWIECAVHGDTISIFVTDQNGKPVPATLMSGTATVLVGGQPAKVELAPGPAHQLTARLPRPVTGEVPAAVSLKIGGEAVTARFSGVLVAR